MPQLGSSVAAVWAAGTLGALILGTECWLLVSGHRVLLAESVLRQETPPPSDGFIWDPTDPVLECRYFTGRSMIATRFTYAPNGFRGRDSCPFLWKPKEPPI